MRSALRTERFLDFKGELPVVIGRNIQNECIVFDLAKMPHLLVAGATGTGKSVGLNVILTSLLYRKDPSQLKLVLIDPKQVEFSLYEGLGSHFLARMESEEENIVIDAQKAVYTLYSLCAEMEERLKKCRMVGTRNIMEYNDLVRKCKIASREIMPYIVVVIDEYADLTMTGGANPDARKCAKNISDSIVRLAQKGRPAGLHVIIATQRPSVNVITGLIKTNFPTRIAFRVVSGVDSRTILDSYGAENLIGRGDMLYYAGVEMERVQCALVSMEEINKITKFIGDQTGWKQCCNTPYYLPVPESQDGETSGGTIDMQNIDPMFADAARMIVTSQRGSTSDLQRRLGMGYARAGRVMDQLEGAGIVGPQEGSKPRQVLVTTFDELDEILSHFIK